MATGIIVLPDLAPPHFLGLAQELAMVLKGLDPAAYLQPPALPHGETAVSLQMFPWGPTVCRHW